MVKFTYCKSFAHAETKEVEWDDFTRVTAKSVGYDTKEESIKRAAIVGGIRADESVGRAENIASRTMASLDYDDLPEGTTLDDIELALELGLDCSFIAYTTFRHTPEAPRFRVFVPLSREVSPAEYRHVVDDIREAIGLEGLDKCSYTVNQIMFLASHRNGTEPWHLSQGGEPWPVAEATPEVAGGIVSGSDVDHLDDLSSALASEPLDITADQVDSLLANYEAATCDYDEWARVGMALAHQFEGSDEGFNRWLEWSKLDADRFNPREMRTKWRSFSGSRNPVTMASVIKAAGGMRGGAVVVADSSVALSLEAEAEAVSDRHTYAAFKQRVQALTEMQLSPDIRSLLAKTVHDVYAKGVGMGLREVKTSFKPLKRGRSADGEEGLPAMETPDWLEGWVYGEADCVFINTSVSDYAIRREAFRAKFDRMPEVVAMETDAAEFALNMVQIPTVVRSMYWPGQPKLFETEGKGHVNSYHPSGIPAADTLEGDDDGQAVVDIFLEHVRNTIEDEREGKLLIDFMSYVYKHAGSRVRWGMLLWGIEGNGKTYFFHVLQQLLGRNATVINTSMIERPFNDWAVGSRLIGIEEIRISGTNKWRVLDQLKPMISNNSIAVEPKGATRYHAPNFASYLMTTNHQDAVPMSDNDRRYCVIFTRHREQADLFEQHGGREAVGKYFDRLFRETERRADAIGRFLLDWKPSAEFDPHGRAPVTAGLKEMRDANVSDDRQAIEDALDDYASAIVSREVLDVTHLNNCITMDGKVAPNGRALASILREMGYRQAEPKRLKVRGSVHYVWFKGRGPDDAKAATERVRRWHSNDEDFTDVPF